MTLATGIFWSSPDDFFFFSWGGGVQRLLWVLVEACEILRCSNFLTRHGTWPPALGAWSQPLDHQGGPSPGESNVHKVREPQAQLHSSDFSSVFLPPGSLPWFPLSVTSAHIHEPDPVVCPSHGLLQHLVLNSFIILAPSFNALPQEYWEILKHRTYSDGQGCPTHSWMARAWGLVGSLLVEGVN